MQPRVGTTDLDPRKTATLKTYVPLRQGFSTLTAKEELGRV